MAIDLNQFLHPVGQPGGSIPAPQKVTGGLFVEQVPLPVQCPPGQTWDPVLGACVVEIPPTGGITTTINCLSNQYWDPILQQCVNLPGPGGGISGGGTIGTGTTTSETGDVGAEGPIFVNVNNAVNVADNSAQQAIQGVGQAVRLGISQGASAANTIAQNTAATISNQISGLTGVLDQSITQAQNNIADVVTGINTDIANTLSGVGADVGQAIFNAINPVSTGLGAIIQVISQQIGGLAGAIGTAVGAVIPQIIGAITGAISPSTAVLQSIAGAIQGNVTALTQIGSDISGGFGSLDSTLQRLLTSWELYNTGFVEAQTGYPDGGSLHEDLSNVWKALAGTLANLAANPNVRLADYITAPCASTTLQTALDTSVGLTDFDNSWFKTWVLMIMRGATWLLKGLPHIQKANQLVEQAVNLECQTGLLEPGALVEAVQRGQLPEPQAIEEAARGNLNLDRYTVLKNLAVHQMSPAELVEAAYRGIITQSDYQTALAAQGWTAGQQSILQGLAVPQIRPRGSNDLDALLQRGLIDGGSYDNILKTLNFDDAQRKALADLVFRPVFQNEETEGLASEDLWGGLGVGGLGQAPESVQGAGAAEGLDSNATNRRWLSHWTAGSIGLWIDLYFRGVASFQQLQAVLRRSFIPDQLHSNIVAGARPLIQFRTISRMVFLKLLTPEQGKAQLLKHGYSDSDADTLIQYALVSGKAPAAQVAKVQHGVSVGIAKEEYIDGSISAAQFYDVLVAHQFTPDGANTEIAVIDAHQAMLARKAAAQLIVDEYGAGLINEQVALAQLAAQGLTVAELAKYAHKIRAFRVKNAKLPTEAELLKMLKANVITSVEYTSTLSQIGYPDPWPERFLQVGVPPTASTGSAPPTAAPTP